MALADVLTQLQARRAQLHELLAAKAVQMPQDASILQSILKLSTTLGLTPTSLEDFYGDKIQTSTMTVVAPAAVQLYGIAQGATPDYNVCYLTLVVQDSSGSDLGWATDLKVYYFDAGKHISLDTPTGYTGVVTIKWYNNAGQLVHTATEQIDGYHTPKYYKRPSGSGNYKLMLNGAEAQLQVYYDGQWVAAPSDGLPKVYTGNYIRTVPVNQTGTAYWTAGEGLNSDQFEYVI